MFRSILNYIRWQKGDELSLPEVKDIFEYTQSSHTVSEERLYDLTEFGFSNTQRWYDVFKSNPEECLYVREMLRQEEIAVQESAIWNLDLYSSLTGHLDCNQVLLTRDIKPDAPYDIRGYAVTGNYFEEFTIEVKSAANGGRYTTFFAELYQVGSMSYSEYLVTPPRFMVYVDTISELHFWYDGITFVNAH